MGPTSTPPLQNKKKRKKEKKSLLNAADHIIGGHLGRREPVNTDANMAALENEGWEIIFICV